MPEYTFRCEACGKRFTVTMGIVEHGKVKVTCPKCSSKKVRQGISAFSVSTKKKS